MRTTCDFTAMRSISGAEIPLGPRVDGEDGALGSPVFGFSAGFGTKVVSFGAFSPARWGSGDEYRPRRPEPTCNKRRFQVRLNTYIPTF